MSLLLQAAMLQCCDRFYVFLSRCNWMIISESLNQESGGVVFLMVRGIRADNQLHFIVYQICLLYATSCMS